MPKVKISEYSTVNSNNTDINSINIDEGCAPSGINNAIREVMVHLKNWQTNASGDGATFASLVVQGTGSFTGAVTMSAGATLSGTNTLSGSNIMSGNINSSGSTNTFSGTVVMSGANTISHAAGTVSAPSITVNGDSNTGIFFPAADTIAFAEGGAEAMRINSSGNVGIGTSSPNAKLELSGTGPVNLRLSDTVTNWWQLESNSYLAFNRGGIEHARITSGGDVLINTTANVNNAKLKSKVSAGSFGLEVTDESQSDFVVIPLSGAVCRVGPTSGAMAFYSANAERARITSGGDLCIGTTATSSSARLNVRRESLTSTTKAANTIAKFGPGTGTNYDANIICSDYNTYDYFFGGRGGVAYVTVNNNQGVQLSAGGTSWSSDSDESLKDIIEPITNAIATVGQWRTVIGKYKTDEADKRRVFFIAQDFQTSLPEAVDESPEGTLLLRYQDAIPVLAAAIKELKAELDTVKVELNALKGA